MLLVGYAELIRFSLTASDDACSLPTFFSPACWKRRNRLAELTTSSRFHCYGKIVMLDLRYLRQRRAGESKCHLST